MNLENFAIKIITGASLLYAIYTKVSGQSKELKDAEDKYNFDRYI